MSIYKTVDPATGETVATFDTATDGQVREAVALAHTGYVAWRAAGVTIRSNALRRAAAVIREDAEVLAGLLRVEVGKPAAEASGEVHLTAAIFAYYADNAETFLADESLDVGGSGTAVLRTEPIGALIGIMPWNYPYYQVARFVAPNLALGNTIVLKHAGNCPQSALAIADVLHRAGVPTDAYVNVFATNDQIADALADPRIQGVSLTGSERAGSAVGEIAGRHRKKYVLELGGSDPLLVLADADLNAAVKAGVQGRLGNAGQACTAIKRIIVADSLYDEYVDRFTRAMEETRVGAPAASDTEMGPLSSKSAVADLQAIVDDAVAKGASVHTGGRAEDGPGAYFPPTVLTNVTSEMRAYHEELFGPVATVYRASNADEAVTLANDSAYGLGASVFTADAELADSVAGRLEAGMVWINSTSKSAPHLPFGGVKSSGVGRELGRLGINEFANKKLIRVPRRSTAGG